jgi:hypothetical protein
MKLQQYLTQQQEQTKVHPTSRNNNNNNNFGTVFVRQTYWLAAIASNPKSATKGFFLSGYVLYVFVFKTCIHVLAVFLRNASTFLNTDATTTHEFNGKLTSLDHHLRQPS